MSFSSYGLVKGLVISLFVCFIAYLGLRSFGVIGAAAKDMADPAVLAETAREALDAVKRRKSTDRRPASYDSIMTPLDQLLRQMRDLLRSDGYNPDRDFPKIRAMASSVIGIATQADRQSRTETGPLAKTYRFNDQKGEACQYLANAMWERINAAGPRRAGQLDQSPQYNQADMDELRKVLDEGIEAAPENRDLRYIRGVVNRAEGLFAPAARDLERAISIDPDYAAAWNTLGLVRISLKEFDPAEAALERAKALALENAKLRNSPPGTEYTAILYNLAMFHEGLASYYNRENRISPSVESRRLLVKHAADARKYLEEFLQREPSDSADARDARARLGALPK